jgi:glutamyl-tRNA reductase
VALLDLDALRLPLETAEETRRAAVPAAERIVADEAARFAAWYREHPARRAVEPLRAVLEEVCRRELAFAAGGADTGRAAERIVAKLMARPMSALRAASARGDGVEEAAALLRTLFADEADAAAGAEPRRMAS